MPNITYIMPKGVEVTIDGKVGASVMETAIRNGVHGIIAECGGSCMCATCHVYVENDPSGVAGNRSEEEQAMLEEAIDAVQPNSRLSCQIKLTEGLDGLKVRIAQNE